MMSDEIVKCNEILFDCENDKYSLDNLLKDLWDLINFKNKAKSFYLHHIIYIQLYILSHICIDLIYIDLFTLLNRV